MMLLERRAIAISLSLVLAGAGSGVLGQQPSRPSQKDKVVLPDDGPPPDQAVQPDPMAPPPAGSQAAPEPEPEPEPEPVVEAPPPPPPAVQAPVEKELEVSAPSTVKEPIVAAASTQKEPVVATPPVALSSDPKQRLLQTQTAALLELAQQLKTEIERAGTNTLSLVALRKAEEIQKLSKNLKQAMQEQEQLTAGK